MPAVVAEVIRKAPLTDEKVTFAWRLAVGPAIGKATTVRLGCRRHAVCDAPIRRRGTTRSRKSIGLIRSRLAHYLGEDAVKRIDLLSSRVPDVPEVPRHRSAAVPSTSELCRTMPLEPLEPWNLGTVESMIMRNAFIVSAVRLPTGKFLGTLKDFTAPELGAMVVREAVTRAGIDPAIVDECIMGNVVSGGVGQAPARQAALKGGLADHVAALTINKVCGSGLKAVMLAHQGIQTGDIDIAVAGGMESMSNCPYIIPKVREGLRMGNGSVVDLMIHDGLWCPFENWHMGNAGETVADVYKVTRDQQDQYSADSHKKAAAAQSSGQVQRRDPAGLDSAEEGRPDRLQRRTNRCAATPPPRCCAP